MTDRIEHLTRTLHAAAAGDPASAEQLLPLMYEELLALARSRMARVAPGDTLQPTALVHEAYLRLVGDSDPGWDGRRHFFGAAARAMRNILVDRARAKATLKRGGARRPHGDSPDPDGQPDFDVPPEDLLALDEALGKLEAQDTRKAQIVTLRFFGGIPNPRIAEILDVSVPTVERDWRFARTWLMRELSGAGGADLLDREPAGPHRGGHHGG